MSEEKLLEELEALKRENAALSKAVMDQKVGDGRKYLPVLGDLVDRLSILQLKECKIPELREQYAGEIRDVLHDINLILKNDKVPVDAEMIRAMVVLGIINNEIWNNEANARSGKEGENNLIFSHSLNGTRTVAKNIIQKAISGRIDFKVDYIDPKWIVSWTNLK